MNLGISDEKKDELAEELTNYLADTYALYLKTQNYHWNVKGIHFHSLHALFEEQYEALAEAVDEVAERIRALGAHAPGSFMKFAGRTQLEEANEQETSHEMLEALTQDHETLARAGRKLVEAAEEAADHATADLVTERIQAHETTAWMLRSHLEE